MKVRKLFSKLSSRRLPQLSSRQRVQSALRSVFVRYRSERPLKKVLWPSLSSALAVVLVIVLTIRPGLPHVQFAYGAFTSTSTDADGNTHLASNTVNGTDEYDTSADSSAATQAQLGVDPNWQNGVVGESRSLKFDGTDDYVSVPVSGSYSSGSISLWVNPSSLALDNIFDTHTSTTCGSAGGGPYLRINSSAGQVAAGPHDGCSGVYSTISASTWTHFVFTWSSKAMTLYKNGVLATSATSSSPIAWPTAAYLGESFGGPGYFSGSLSDVRLYSRALSAGEVSALYSHSPQEDTSGLTGWWKLNDGTGTTAKDSAGLNDGTLTNFNFGSADGWQSKGPSAVIDGDGGKDLSLSTKTTSSVTNNNAYEVRTTGSNALSFSGSAPYVSMGSSTAVGSTFTIEAWVNKAATGLMTIVGQGNSAATQNTFFFRIGGAGANSGFTTGTNVFKEILVPDLSLSTWHDVALVYDGAQLRYYLDGVLTASGNMSGVPDSLSNTTKIGQLGDYAASQRWNGQLDEVRISNTARYTSNFTPSRRFATDGNTVGLWHLDEGTGTTTADSSGNGNTGTLMNGSTNSPAADGTTNGPIWTEGIAADPSAASTSANWAMPGYQFRKQLKVTNNVASTLGAGYGVETTDNRGTALDNHQTLPSGNDWRVQYQPPSSKTSLGFNGSSQYLKIPDISTLTPATSLTLELWAKFSASQKNRVLAGHWENTGYLMGVDYQTGNDNKIRASIKLGGTLYSVTSSATYNDGQWHHYALTYNNAKLVLFVDGVSVGSVSAAGTLQYDSPSQPFTVGAYPDASGAFNGQVDEVRVSNFVRYAANFTPSRAPSVSDSHTAGLWHLDEGSGSVAADSSGNQNNGMLIGSPTWNAADGAVSTAQEVPRFIPHGSDLSLDGSTQYVSVADSPSLAITGPITVEAWVKFNSVATAGMSIVNRRTAANKGGYVLETYGSGNSLVFYIYSGGSWRQVNTSAGAVTAGQWYHIAGTYDGNTMRLFVNGVQQAATAYSGTINNPPSPLVYIGKNAATGTSLSGQIDEVRISSTARYRSNFTPSTAPFARDQYTAALWHLDDGSGTTAADSSGNGNTGTLTNSPTWVANGGKVDSINETKFKTVVPVAASGTDSNYYLYYGNPNEQGSAQSYGAYGLKFDGTNDYVAASTGGSLSQYTIPFLQIGGAGRWQFVNAVNPSDLATVGKWDFLVGIQDATSQHLYVNGVDVNDSSGTSTLGTALNIGRRSDGIYFNGTISETRLYSRALSSTEVTALYSNIPTVSNTGLVGWWKLSDTTPAGTTAADSSGSGNPGTLTNFNFDGTSNWIVNPTLQHATTEPTLTDVSATPEQESPIFYQWRQAAGTWSTRSQLSANEQQLGTEGVYVLFNPEGSYSRNDYFRINSWAVEAFSSNRGKLRTFPAKAHLVASNGGLDIIDASTNKLWARFSKAASDLVGSNNTLSVTALNGHLYVSSADGLTDISLPDDTATRYTSSGNSLFAGNVSQRNAASGYGTASGTAISSTGVNEASAMASGGQQYVALATASNADLIQNATATPAVIQYARTSADAYAHAFLTPGGKLYAADSTAGGLDRWDAVTADASNKLGSPAPSATYTTATTPALISNGVNSISVTEGTSTSDYVSNQVALGTDLGADLINENTTLASGFVKHYTRTGAVGSSNYSQKQFGGALKLNGTNQYLAIPDASSLRPTTVTAEAWVKFSSLSDGQTILSKDKNPGQSYILDIGVVNTGMLEFCAYSSSWSCASISSATLSTNTWYHIAGVYDGSNLNLYVNGISKGTASLGSLNYSSSNLLTIGRYYAAGTGANYLNGSIDEVRISNIARYTSSFTPSTKPFSTDANTAALYHFDEGSGQNVYDDSSNANNGTLGATSSVASDDPVRVYPALAGSIDKVTAVGLSKSGDAGQDLRFDGTDDYVSAGSSAALDPGSSQALTVSFWMKTSSATNGQRLVIRRGSVGSYGAGYDISVVNSGSTGKVDFYTGNALVGVGGVVYSDMTGNKNVSDNAWHHVVCVYSSGIKSIYVDGALDAAASGAPALATATTSLYLGSYRGGVSNYYNGALSDVRIYTRALSASELSVLYNSGHGRTDSPSGGLVGWWKLNDASGTSAKDSISTNTGTLTNFNFNGTDGWTIGSPVKQGISLWVGTSSLGSNTGALTDISLDTDRQVSRITTSSNSSLPNNDITSLSILSGGLALAGTLGGAWAPGTAGYPVDDTAITVAIVNNPVRVESGTVRIGRGSVRVP